MKNRDEVDALKENWRRDPCYDLSPPPEGFEEYADELRSFEETTIAEWQGRFDRERDKGCERLGIPGNYKLLNHLNLLGKRVKELEKEIETIRNLLNEMTRG